VSSAAWGIRPLFFFAVLLLAGCAPNLYVTDEQGNPVEGAEIWRLGSVARRIAVTDQEGTARIYVSPEGTVIRKEGYSPHLLRLNDPEPRRVALRRSNP